MENAKTSTQLKVAYTIFDTWLPLLIKNVFQDEFAGITVRDLKHIATMPSMSYFVAGKELLHRFRYRETIFDDISTPAIGVLR
jgi:hypothetical protein